jgi:hypothetical protein
MLLAIINVFVYKKNIIRYINSYNVFSIILITSLYWIPKGFDITDEGFILSKSWFMWHGMWHENIGKIWGTTFINGLWLSIIGEPNLLWARLGYAILISLISTITYKILIIYFNKNEAFISVIIISLISFIGFPQTINYQNFPILLILLSFLFYIKGIKQSKKYFLILAGALISFGIYARVTIIVLSVYPVILYLLSNIKKHGNKTKQFTTIIIFYIGSLFGGLTGILILFLTNSLNDYVSSFINTINTPKNLNPTHTLTHLIDLYQKDIWNIFSNSLVIGIILLMFTILVNKAKSWILKLIISAFFLWIGFYYLKISKPTEWMFLFISLGLSAFLLFTLFTKIKKELKPLLVFSLLLFFFSFVGSAISFKVLLSTGAAILPISAFIIILYSTALNLDGVSYKFSTSIIVVIIFIFLQSFMLKADKIYRDQHVNFLKYPFSNNQLEGIRSNKNRVLLVDSLLTFVNDSVKKSESIMYIGKIPMMYYLTNKKYFTNDLWRQPSGQFEKSPIYNIPDYFIFAKKNPRDSWWPDGGSSAKMENDSINLQYYNKFVKKYPYIEIYKNAMFCIFRKNISPQLDESLNKGLIAYFPFKGNTNDDSKNDNHSENYGAKLAKNRFGLKESASEFNGKEYIKIKNDSSLNPGNYMTICAWYKPVDFKGSGSDPIITKGFYKHTPPYYQYHLSVTGISYNSENKGTISFSISIDDKLHTVSTSNKFLEINKWYFIAATYDNTAISLFINGIKVASIKASGKIKDYEQDILIGKANNFNGFIKGTIDDIRIYKRALTIREILFLYGKNR